MLTTSDIATKLNVKPVTIHKRIVDGSFPQPDEMNGRRRLWNVGTVSAWTKANKALLKSMAKRSERRTNATTKKPVKKSKTKKAA